MPWATTCRAATSTSPWGSRRPSSSSTFASVIATPKLVALDEPPTHPERKGALIKQVWAVFSPSQVAPHDSTFALDEGDRAQRSLACRGRRSRSRRPGVIVDPYAAPPLPSRTRDSRFFAGTSRSRPGNPIEGGVLAPSEESPAMPRRPRTALLRKTSRRRFCPPLPS